MFQNKFIETTLKDAPSAVHILLGGTTIDKIPLVVLGYRQSYKKCRISKLGDPYYMRHIDSFGNICTWYVDHPQVILNFFAGGNVIDTQNQLYQDESKLENI